MLLAYVDESYSAKWPSYWVGAVVCAEGAVASLTNALDTVVREAAWKYDLALEDQAELHGHPLFHGRGTWAGLKHKQRARVDVYSEALRAIAAHEVWVIIRGVHRARLQARYGASAWHPHRVALQYLLENVDQLAGRMGQPALVIADEISSAVEHRRELWDYQHRGTTGYRAQTLVNVVDTLHFAPSHASRLVQAADLVTFLYGRKTSGLDVDARAVKANEDLWSILAPRIEHVLCWHP